jgi:ubiquinone/menaquinone biosynthesis C-methylase UbiE
MSTVGLRSERVRLHFGALAQQGVWASLYNPGDRVTSEHWGFLIRARRVTELLEAHGGELREVLDVGCGTAPIARALVAMGCRYTGIDFSREMVEEARRVACDLVADRRARMEVGNALALSFGTESYDAVLGMGLLEYLTPGDVPRALAELRRVLRPGGVAVLTIPKRWHWTRLVERALAPVRWLVRASLQGRGRLERREGFERLYLTPEELDGLCAGAGLAKVDERHYNVQPLCRPANVLAPRLCYLVNRPFEGLARLPGGRFLASGYVGMYRRD